MPKSKGEGRLCAGQKEIVVDYKEIAKYIGVGLGIPIIVAAIAVCAMVAFGVRAEDAIFLSYGPAVVAIVALAIIRNDGRD